MSSNALAEVGSGKTKTPSNEATLHIGLDGTIDRVKICIRQDVCSRKGGILR
jgi:hypothetical protein